MQSRRLKKWAKWVCTVALGAAVSLSVLSGFCTVWRNWYSSDHTDEWYLGLSCGVLILIHNDWTGADRFSWRSEWYVLHAPGWDWGTSGRRRGVSVISPWRGGLLWNREPDSWAVGTSVLYPIALMAIPTGLLWYTDRRRVGPGRCARCGYDRRGLAADAKCPECGAGPSE